MEEKGVWNLGQMGMLSCMSAGIGMLVSVLVLVVVVVLAVVLLWLILTVWAVEGVLAVVVVMMMVQGVLVEVNCVGVVSGSRSGGFAVVVVLEGFRLMSRSSWRNGFLVLEWEERLFGTF